MVDRTRIVIYTISVLALFYVGTLDYLKWLNPLDMKPEENPKQHDGSQEFNPHQEWESVITPIDEDGVTRHLDPYELWQHGTDDEVLLETEQLPTEQMGED